MLITQCCNLSISPGRLSLPPLSPLLTLSKSQSTKGLSQISAFQMKKLANAISYHMAFIFCFQARGVEHSDFPSNPPQTPASASQAVSLARHKKSFWQLFHFLFSLLFFKWKHKWKVKGKLSRAIMHTPKLQKYNYILYITKIRDVYQWESIMNWKQ